ncbi:MAG: twin-arginine translocase TatA/TatE family subunit [Desulfitobacteriia bacterium]|jgi:sec-independent protein translocase protein TatA
MYSLVGMITPTVAVILLIIALIIFGPGKLPDLGKALGGGIKEFRAATKDEQEEKSEKKNEASS